jgi:transposase InsO family protein
VSTIGGCGDWLPALLAALVQFIRRLWPIAQRQHLSINYPLCSRLPKRLVQIIRQAINALRYFRSFGVPVHRVMTDNGTGFRSFRYVKALRLLKFRHLRTKPYTPKTNGKAERFVQTSLRESAYARTYPTSDERKAELPRWLHQYNWHRPHGGIKHQTPVSRLRLTQNNLLRPHS